MKLLRRHDEGLESRNVALCRFGTHLATVCARILHGLGTIQSPASHISPTNWHYDCVGTAKLRTNGMDAAGVLRIAHSEVHQLVREREYGNEYVGCHSRHEGANVRLWEELLLPVLESHTASP